MHLLAIVTTTVTMHPIQGQVGTPIRKKPSLVMDLRKKSVVPTDNSNAAKSKKWFLKTDAKSLFYGIALDVKASPPIWACTKARRKGVTLRLKAIPDVLLHDGSVVKSTH